MTMSHTPANQNFPGRSLHWIYVLQGEATGLIKVGRAQDPCGRLRGLQGGSPDRLRLLALMPSWCVEQDERNLHRRWAACRSHGEWFIPTNEMLIWAQGACRANAHFRRLVEDSLTSVWARHRQAA